MSNEEKVRLLVGALVSGVLLLLYAYVLGDAIAYAWGWKDGLRAGHQLPTEGAFWILQTIGSLVSALVTAQLAVAPRPGDPGKAELFLLGGAEGKWATIIALAYLAVWLLLGFAAVIAGLVHYEHSVPELAAFAKAWIGVAVAAAYAYLGIKAPGR